MIKWISIEEQRPEQGRYLFFTKTKGVATGFVYDYASRYKRPEALIEGRGRQFTHWAEIPEPPVK